MGVCCRLTRVLDMKRVKEHHWSSVEGYWCQKVEAHWENIKQKHVHQQLQDSGQKNILPWTFISVPLNGVSNISSIAHIHTAHTEVFTFKTPLWPAVLLLYNGMLIPLHTVAFHLRMCFYMTGTLTLLMNVFVCLSGDSQDQPPFDSQQTSNPMLVMCVVIGLVGGILPLSAVMTYFIKKKSYFKKGMKNITH